MGTAAQARNTERSLTDVFLSYSRDDIAFVERLQASLEEREITAHRDQHDIEKGEDWWRRLTQLMTASDSIVFVLSPSSATSEVCRKEVEFAARLNKRFVPVVIADLAGTTPPAELQRLNYIFFVPDERAGACGDFDEALEQLVHALRTDLDWVREHTRLGSLAQRWEDRKMPRGMLLRGSELETAERWMSTPPASAPSPTPATLRFVAESRRTATRQLRQITIGSAIAAVAAIAVMVFSITQWNRAEAEARTATAGQLAVEAQSLRETNFDEALLFSVSAFELEENIDTLAALAATASFAPQTIALLGKGERVTQVAASPTENVFALGYADGSVTLWDAERRQDIRTLAAAPGGPITALSFDRQGAQIVFAQESGRLRLWDPASTTIRALVLDAGQDAPRTLRLAFSPEGTQLAEVLQYSVDDGERLRLWDLAAPQPIGTQPYSESFNHVEHMSFPIEDVLRLVDWGTRIDIVTKTGAVYREGPSTKLPRPGPSAYDQYGEVAVASGFDNGSIYSFFMRDAADIGEAEVALAPLDALAIHQGLDSAGNTARHIAAAQERTLTILDESGIALDQFDSGAPAITQIVFGPNLSYIAALSLNGQVHIFDLAASNRLSTALEPSTYVPSVIQAVIVGKFSPEGSYLAWIGRESEDSYEWALHVHSFEQRKTELHAIPQEPFFEIEFFTEDVVVVRDAAGEQVAIALAKTPVGVLPQCETAKFGATWQASPGADLVFARCRANGPETADHRDLAESLQIETDRILATSLSENGTHLAIATDDMKLILIDIANAKDQRFNLRDVVGPSATANSELWDIALSPNAETLVIGILRGRLGLYNVDDMQANGTFHAGRYGEIDTWEEFVFSANGARLAVTRGAGKISLWDTQSAQMFAEFQSGADVPVRDLIFDPQDRYLAEMLVGGGLTLWSIDPQAWRAAACKLVGRSMTERERQRAFPNQKYQSEVSGCSR